MEQSRHWAESLRTADLCLVQLNCGETVEVLVHTNRPNRKEILCCYGFKTYKIPYEKLRPKE